MQKKLKISARGHIRRFLHGFWGYGGNNDNSLLPGIAILVKNDYLCTSGRSGRRSTFVIIGDERAVLTHSLTIVKRWRATVSAFCWYSVYCKRISAQHSAQASRALKAT